MQRLQEVLQRTEKESKHLTFAINRLEIERALTQKGLEEAEASLAVVEEQLKQAKQKDQQLASELMVAEKKLMAYLRQMYQRGPLGYYHVFLSETELEMLVSSMYLLAYVTEKEKQQFQSFLAMKKEQVLIKNQLESLQYQQTQTRDGLIAKRKDVSTFLKNHRDTLNHLLEDRANKATYLQELEEDKKSLEQFVLNFKTGETSRSALPPISIAHYKGNLNWPVDGTVFRHFGSYKDSEFQTKKEQNGIDIAVERGQPVQAVYGGEVLYSDWFKSYGNLVILNHGDGYLTFYAHLDQMNVQRGQRIERGQTIGRSGDSGSLEGPYLHFELRKKQLPEDPEQWLKQIKPRKRR